MGKETVKQNLTDVTFIIPLRIDTEERLENFEFIINYLNKFFDTNIMVQENDASPKANHISGTQYTFVEDTSVMFYKTKILNEMTRKVTTPIIVEYDCDVIFPPESYTISAELLRNDQFDFVYPYDGITLDISRDYMPQIKNGDFRNITGKIVNTQTVGGCVFWNRKVFIEGGMENEQFISWGTEDIERYERFLKLGYRMAHLVVHLFHFHHRRIPINDSKNPFTEHNDAELKKVMSMTKEQLQEYVKTWY